MKSKRTRISSVRSAVDIFGGLRRFHREGSRNGTNHYVESLRTLPLTPSNAPLLDNVAFHHSLWLRAFADSRGADQLFIPPYAPWLNRIDGVFSIVKRNDHFTERIDESFRTR